MDVFEEELNYWRLCDEFSVIQAAALIVGVSPACVFNESHKPYLAIHPCDAGPSRFDPLFQAAFSALKNATVGGTLSASIRYSAREYGYADMMADIEYNEILFEDGKGRTAEDGEILSGDQSCFYKPFPDWSLSTIKLPNLKAWLSGRGVKSDFFFPEVGEAKAGYLDKEHECYAPKLAAAIHAWEAVVGNPELLRGKSPKAALSKWLNENAAGYGLTKDDGTPNATGVEEAAKIANWKPEGGATKTPV